MKMTEAQKKLINTTPRMNFDTRMGISKMLKEEYGLQKLSELRKLYRELHPEWKLCEFVTNGEFLLTREGEVHQILGVIPNRGQLPEVVIVEDFLKKAHFPYAIGYGLTETAPLICNACVGKTAVGSIGVPAWKVQVKLQNVNPETGEGEIVAKGDNVMLGYYKDPERTREVLTDDGWFRTHDLACKDAKGRYYIKGRLNNMILGPSGENIYPEEIEQVINHIGGVNESLVMERDGKLVALVKFDDNVLNWDQAYEDKFFETLQARKKAVLDYVNKHVGKSSKVNTVEVVKDNFEKTATQKIRRFKYKDAHGDDVAVEEEKKKD